ncbi:short-chain dehydrogenase [Xanthomonas oryzae pv. oryzicola]|nr:short-chain dehydrogenase [Xanthomonas oryzae pv. oryzicola]
MRSGGFSGATKYLASLQQRGLIRPRQGGWEVVPPPHREDLHTLAATQATTQRT